MDNEMDNRSAEEPPIVNEVDKWLNSAEEPPIDNEMDDEDDDIIIDDEGMALDNSEQVFEGHGGEEVYCVNMHPTETTFAVSGGKDDKAYIWNVETSEMVFECSGHTDSVVFADFNKNGSMLATIDMKGCIQVWKMETKEKICTFQTEDVEQKYPIEESNEESDPPQSTDVKWATWHPLGNILLVGLVSGTTYMWNVPNGEYKQYPGPGLASPCTSGAINPDGKSAVFGYKNGSTRIYDLATSQLVFSFIKGRELHFGQVNYVSYDRDGKNLTTASSDGWSKIINTTTGKIVATYQVSSHRPRDYGEGTEASVECATINSRFNLLAQGSLDQHLYIWNLATKQLVKKIEHPDGITKILWDGSGSKVFTACLDGVCRLWNGRSGECLFQFHGAEGSILDISLSKNEKWLVAASADGNVRSYSLEETT